MAAVGVAGAVLLSCSRPETPADVLGRLPATAGGLTAAGPDEVFQAAAIFSYLDGGAEVYLAYNLRSCVVRRYAGASGELIVDLFDMGSSADAFGVFSRDLDGEAVAVGDGGRLRTGWLSAWKGPFYLSITADRDDGQTQRTLLELGRAVASAVRSRGPRPALLRRLPPDGLDTERLAYAHDHVTLASHVTLPAGNPRGLDRSTEGAGARNRRGAATATLLLVSYPAPASASDGAVRLAQAWGAAPGVATRDQAGRLQVTAAQGPIVAAVIGSTDEETTHALLADALSGNVER